MEKKQIIELVGKDTVLEFQCMVDSVMEYKTVIPQLVGGEYIDYKIMLFHEMLQPIFRSDTLSGFLDKFQIFELAEVRDLPTQYKEIHSEQYKSKQ